MLLAKTEKNNIGRKAEKALKEGPASFTLKPLPRAKCGAGPFYNAVIIDYSELGNVSTVKDIYSGFGEGFMTLKYSGKLDLFRRMKGWTIRQMSEKIGVTPDRMEYLLAGKHEPKAADIIRTMKRLEITFEPEDFETEGVPEKL